MILVFTTESLDLYIKVQAQINPLTYLYNSYSRRYFKHHSAYKAMYFEITINLTNTIIWINSLIKINLILSSISFNICCNL